MAPVGARPLQSRCLQTIESLTALTDESVRTLDHCVYFQGRRAQAVAQPFRILGHFLHIAEQHSISVCLGHNFTGYQLASTIYVLHLT